MIVALDLPVRMEADLPTQFAAGQRSNILAVQDAVLARLTGTRLLHKYTVVPYLALEVDEADLQALSVSPEVASIALDELSAPTLIQSTSLVGAPPAWSAGYTGGGWAVAILDSGVDKFHPFLVGRVVSEACYSSNSSLTASVCPGGVSNSTAAGSAMPCGSSGCEHGTHVAGIAAGNNGAFAGVAPDANVIAIQVFSYTSTGIGTWASDQMAALQRVYDLRNTHNIAAVNMSVGGGAHASPCDSDPRKPLIDQLRAAGIATIVASGNDGYVSHMSAPACISSAVSVASTTDGSSGIGADQVSWFSNTNAYLTLLAPGEIIFSSVPGGAYAANEGTSMAAPHVAGAVALIRSGRPAASVSSIVNALVSTGVPVYDAGNGLTFRRINVNAALQSLCTYSVSPTQLSFNPHGGTASLNVNTAAGCSWVVSELSSFVSVHPQSGAGPQAINVVVAPNGTGTPRMGAVSIAGTVITITQMGQSGGDLNGDGRADLIWQNSANGSLAAWYMDGADVVATSFLSVASVDDLNWRIVGSGDLDGNGAADLVWQHNTDGGLAAWFMNGTTVVGTQFLSVPINPDLNWKIRGVADFDGDGKADIVWQHLTEGWLALWSMNGAQVVNTRFLSVGRVEDSNWRIAGAGDTNGDGKADILWQHETEGWLAVWYMNDAQVTGTQFLSIGQVGDPAWRIVAVGDTSGDGTADLIWRNQASGEIGIWYLTGHVVTGTVSTIPVSDLTWRIVGPG